ncbi:hypothetical protein [Streptomyces sp. ID05-47C]|uniref:hypothetical protein n=1 Tax=Streptomyces sp. ID05-47C TaxID=3028665 RepID=UPI0029BED786|nr:hypothetical protein [Streptomyces sp. ID05-47C]MDX3573435.1 hypothetical protein [Streptomyces sp. ID05-47C]
MGIESDQVVYEYLSRVGDVAQQRQLSSATRMRLVSELRNEIDRRRAKAPVDSPAAVRRILDRLGSPLGRRGASGGGSCLRWAGTAAGAHELGDVGETPDWWGREASPFGLGEEVPGFVGGVEIADMLRPPPKPSAARPEPVERLPEPDEEEPAARRRRFLPSLPGGRWSNPFLLVAAACLVAGTVTGTWIALLVGWALAYVSRRLSEAEKKWAVFVLPGLAATGGIVWIWGRTAGRWGTPIPEGHMNEALAQTWPWVLRGAAVASALFLVWRSQRDR